MLFGTSTLYLVRAEEKHVGAVTAGMIHVGEGFLEGGGHVTGVVAALLTVSGGAWYVSAGVRTGEVLGWACVICTCLCASGVGGIFMSLLGGRQRAGTADTVI